MGLSFGGGAAVQPDASPLFGSEHGAQLRRRCGGAAGCLASFAGVSMSVSFVIGVVACAAESLRDYDSKVRLEGKLGWPGFGSRPDREHPTAIHGCSRQPASPQDRHFTPADERLVVQPAIALWTRTRTRFGAAHRIRHTLAGQAEGAIVDSAR